MTALNCIGITDSGRAQRDSEMENVPASRGMRRRPRSAARAGIPAVVAAIAMYIFVTISRVSDEFPSLHLALVTAGITAALALFGAKVKKENEKPVEEVDHRHGPTTHVCRHNFPLATRTTR